MRELLAGVPEPLADLDHVQATAETVLARVRYLHEHYELERCRVLLLGDHDATSLAFERAGRAAARARASSTSTSASWLFLDGVDTWFADLRVGLPAPLRGRFDIVLTDPPYSPAGVGLFAARALEAMKREARLLVAYGYPEGSPALGLKVQAELSALELVYEAVLPDFNAYDGALAIGSRAPLYVLRPTKRSAKIAARRGARHAEALYTRGRQAVESEPRARLLRELSAGRRTDRLDAAAPSCSRRRVERRDGLRRPHARPRLQPLPGGRWRRCAERVVILAHNRTEGLRTAAEQALLRQLAAPRYEVVQLARSWQGTPFTLVELRGGGPRDEREVYRDATSTSIARVASGAPQSSSEAGVATRVAGARDGDLAAQRPLGERVGEALLGRGAVARVLR